MFHVLVQLGLFLRLGSFITGVSDTAIPRVNQIELIVLQNSIITHDIINVLPEITIMFIAI